MSRRTSLPPNQFYRKSQTRTKPPSVSAREELARKHGRKIAKAQKMEKIEHRRQKQNSAQADQ